MSVILYVAIYEKRFHMQLNILRSTAMAFNLFLEWKPMEKLQPMISMVGEAPVYTVAQETSKLPSIVAFV